METVLSLTAATALPILLSVLLYTADRQWTVAPKISPAKKQVIIGILFGGAAVLGTEFGIDIGGAVLNVRDAAVLCAALIFGGPAGIIAGVIGGTERWFSVLWGGGEYTRLACSLATVLAGFLGAGIRKYIFDNKKTTWSYGLLTSVVVEVLHMLMIFLTNMSDVSTAFTFVEICALPMIALNALSVTLATLFVSLIGRKKKETQRDLRQISQTFQRYLAAVVTVAFLITMVFSWVLQTELSRSNAQSLLTLNIADVKQDITDASDENLVELAYRVRADINSASVADMDELLHSLCETYSIAEINIVDQNGFITASTTPSFLGYDMSSGEQSGEFMTLLSEAEEYVQAYGPVSFDDSVSRKYAGVRLENGGFVQVGYDAVRFQADIDEQVVGVTRNRHIGEGGCIIIANESWNIVSDRSGNEGENLYATGIWIDTVTMPEGEYFTAEVYGVTSYCTYEVSEGYYIIAVLPQAEAFFLRNVSVYLTVFMEVLIFVSLFILAYYLIKKLIVENIHKINSRLGEITGGNLEVTVDVRTNEEFASLSDDINSTVGTLKQYISEAAARIDQELEYAKAIQLSALPRVFPPYPGRADFDVYAAMRAAKEVGGDFYDFYFVEENKLVLLIADVSGKGIPAAMFMMTAKTMIKSLAESGLAADEILTRANEQLCENNDTGMFVTVWLGIVDTESGVVSFANAGHNPPAVLQNSGEFEFLKTRPGFVLAGMDGIKYRKNEFLLAPGDRLYLYTDGVTEATDQNNALYGEQRLLKILNENAQTNIQTLCKEVQEDVDRFVGKAPQFDDITMLAFERKSGVGDDAAEIEINSDIANLEKITAFAESMLEEHGAPMKVIAQVNVAVDEIFSNIAKYSGAAKVSVSCKIKEDALYLRFADDGTPYDPTKQPEPDTTLSAEDRDIGGLGIHLVRKTMDDVQYQYVSGKNVLTVKKTLTDKPGTSFERSGEERNGHTYE